MDNEQWKKLREFFTKIDFFPTHNFEEMKEYRLKEIGKRKAIEFFQEMKKNGNDPTQSDFDFFEMEFLKNELSLIDEKIKDVSISNKLQLEKYRKHIELLLSEGTGSDKQEQSKYNFSVLEWATIFYYADEAKLLPTAKTKKKRQETFMKDWSISTTPDNFKNNCIEANNRINKRNDYPIDKLNKIEPFLQEYYSYAVAKMWNDKDFLQNEIDENE